MSNVINKQTMVILKSVDTPKYPTSEWIINPIFPECESKYWKITEDEVIEMTTSEKLDIDEAILIPMKVSRVINFGELVKSKVEEGFTFNVNGIDEKFGSSELDQANWNSSISFNDAEDYPLAQEVKNWDGDYVLIQNEVTNKSIAKAGKERVNNYRKKFYDFKKAVLDNSIDTQTKLDAIKDEDYI